jgi:hypothetical protein
VTFAGHLGLSVCAEGVEDVGRQQEARTAAPVAAAS